jgi:hypothetical protein
MFNDRRGLLAATKRILAAVIMVPLFLEYPGTCIAQQKTATETAHEQSYKYDTAGVRLEGRLIERKVYGPPGYGETPAQDERDTILILKVLHPITVEPIPGAVAKSNPNAESFRHVREVQLFVPPSAAPDADKMVGRLIVACGVLNEHVAPSDHTDVWMAVKTLGPK